MMGSITASRKIARHLPGMLLAAVLAAGSSPVWAQWELASDRSAINFVSIKNNSVAEVHSFGSLVGYIGEDGALQVGINLDSVQTNVDIRDQRMREMFFETGEFPTASITGQVEPALLEGLAGGGTVTADVPVTLSLHGRKKELSVPVVVIGEAGGALHVFSRAPVVVDAADFGLADGVTALREVVGLDAISTAVPVSLQLLFSPAE